MKWVNALRKELEGVLVREKGEPAVRTPDGKVRLIYNLLDGLASKRVRITVEEVKEEEEEKKEEGKAEGKEEGKAAEKKEQAEGEKNSNPQ